MSSLEVRKNLFNGVRHKRMNDGLGKQDTYFLQVTATLTGNLLYIQFGIILERSGAFFSISQ